MYLELKGNCLLEKHLIANKKSINILKRMRRG